MTDIATIGHLTRDVVADAAPRPGGAAFFAARTLARLGADARVAVACAARDREALLPPVEAFGLPVAWHESTTTAGFSFRYAGDRRIMQLDAVGDPWRPEQALATVGDAAWIHVGALTRTDFPAETLAALARGGRCLLVDAQGLVRRPDLGALQTDGHIGDALEHVTVLKLNDEEAETLLGTSQPEDLVALGLPEVILTLGSHGSFVVTPQLVEHVPARVVVGPVDPTGAGDTFSAAYLVARAEGADPRDAADHATIAVAAFLAEP